MIIAEKRPFAAIARRRSTNDASESVARKVAMIVELLRRRDFRSFRRDLRQLHKIGLDAGFQIS